MNKDKISQYLERLQITEAGKPTIKFLSLLHKQHQLNIPFENLDIHYKKQIFPDTEKFFGKLILSKRGGFCYEQNGLFFELVKAIGFNVEMLSAQVYNHDRYGPEFDHMALKVSCEGTDLLLDVGFGDFAFSPLNLGTENIQDDERGQFRIEKSNTGNSKVWRKEKQGDWKPVYKFSLIPRQLNEFAGMCTYHQSSPDSFFTKGKLCTLPTAGGRKTLTDEKLKLEDGDEWTEIKIVNETDFQTKLNRYFGITLLPAAVS
jgi:N-hydroxyarylamine O-acetyltransferase